MAHSTMLSTACPEKTRRKGERETEREREIGGGTGTSLFSVYLALWYSVSHNKALCGVSAYAGLTSCACQNEKTAKQRPRGSPPLCTFTSLRPRPCVRSAIGRAGQSVRRGRGGGPPPLVLALVRRAVCLTSGYLICDVSSFSVRLISRAAKSVVSIRSACAHLWHATFLFFPFLLLLLLSESAAGSTARICRLFQGK